MAQFWNRRYFAKSCGECRFKARVKRRLPKQAAWRAEKAASEAFWAAQLARESSPSSP